MGAMTGSGSVQTVLGPVAPEALGITLPHEHLLCDLGPRYVEPADAEGRVLAHQLVTLANLRWVRRHYLSNHDNIVLDDEQVAIEEAGLFAAAGGGTIVDAGSIGIRPDPHALRRISEATGLHVVAATGFYTEDFHPPDMDARTEDELTEEIVRDLRSGIGATGIRAGIIGEVGCSWPLHPNERKSLRAAARAQRETGAPISIHPGRDQAAPFEILEILAAAGADPARVVIGHIERTEFEPANLVRLARTGCYVEFDWFGEVLSMHPTGPVNVPSDTERIDQIRMLIGEGHAEQVLASHDVCLKTRLERYGGGGYGHIPRDVTTWMAAKGMSADEIDLVARRNPQRMLAIG
jgi:phosphotriesterase-related protein